MEKYYLVEYEANWADEIDLKGHFVLNSKEMKEFKNKLNSLTEFHFNLGGNQTLEYYDVESLERDFSYKEIVESDYFTLKNLGLLNSGINPYLSVLSMDKSRQSDVKAEAPILNVNYSAYDPIKHKRETKIIPPIDDIDLEGFVSRLRKDAKEEQ